ncbi:chemotaxis protein CheB [Couchioplanes azureus]|uniref:chemotaxis protein CheB n=1 Tax=Couchioplanes caeruleus TaxID=56438 RepID=UPI001670F37B
MVLHGLPARLPVGVAVQQPLGGHGSALVPILEQRVARAVSWAADGEPLAAGSVLVCPPRKRVEALPDRTVALFDAGAAVRDAHDTHPGHRDRGPHLAFVARAHAGQARHEAERQIRRMPAVDAVGVLFLPRRKHAGRQRRLRTDERLHPRRAQYILDVADPGRATATTPFPKGTRRSA